MNKVILIGHVGKAPDYKTLQTGSEVASFSMATTERWTSNGEKKEDTSWHQIVFWGKMAKLCKDYVFKGSKVMVEGRLKYETYEQDGVKKYATKIIGEKIEFLSKKDSSSSEEPSLESEPHFDSEDDIPF